MQDEVHLGKTGGIRVLLLTKDGNDGSAVCIYRGFIGSPNQKASAACCRIVQCPFLDAIVTDATNTNQAGNDTGDLAWRVELSLALTRLLCKLHHEVFVSVTDDIIAAGTIGFEVYGGILEYSNQAGNLVNQLFAGAELIRVIKADIRERTDELVFCQKALDDFINALTDIRLTFCGDKVVK